MVFKPRAAMLNPVNANAVTMVRQFSSLQTLRVNNASKKMQRLEANVIQRKLN